MKLLVLQENLSRGLNIVNKIASSKTVLPILNNILFEANPGVLNLSTTNLEIAIITSIRAKVEKEGKITIPSQILTNYISLLEKDPLTLQLIDTEIQIKSKKSQAKIKCISAEEFPLIPTVVKKEKIIFQAKDFKNALSKIASLISPTETRIEISGILFKSNSQEKMKFVLAGTDSYRLAEKVIEAKKATKEDDLHLIIPVRTIQELIRVIGEQGEVEFYPSENQILFVYQETKIISRLIAGQFPDYQQIIPTNFKTKVRAEKDAFLRGIKAVSMFSRIGINDISLKINKSSVLISSVNSPIGESVFEMPAEVDGEANTIIFNYHYLLDGFSSLVGQEIILEIVNDAAPAIIRSEAEEDYFYLVMPIKQ